MGREVIGYRRRPWEVRKLVQSFWRLQPGGFDGFSPYTTNVGFGIEYDGFETFGETVFTGEETTDSSSDDGHLLLIHCFR
ncbi:hypothetical protein HanRHA438_Chr15g0703381 [Helianthus annuus]|nr:hypothetical protein HanRHA438_Chr15g0703381 [Helianthus annuus]